ncbi:hypothetical protein [Paraburkholderia kururiensis]|uniref:hypothetical protein n=1 Tax=Paraburkholderia kururiensis TaxID=984307 RepID=UPI0012693D2F|nr:hypothetical protein [Paraburkholderia kururiensis]
MKAYMKIKMFAETPSEQAAKLFDDVEFPEITINYIRPVGLPLPKPQFAESGEPFLARLAVGLQTRLQRINLVAHKPMRRSVGRDVTRQE